MGSRSSHEAVASDVVAETFDFVRNADECARALASATEAMDASLEVYEGILRLIADFAGPYPWPKFDKGPHLKYFHISNNGLTARLNGTGVTCRYVCVSPSFDSGARVVLLIASSSCIHECVFHVFHVDGAMLGVVPVSKATQDTRGHDIGQFYYNGYYGWIYGPGHRPIDTGVTYGDGDAITVTLDLDANTVAFAKNGAEVPYSTVSIANEAHYFALNVYSWNNGEVTIVSMT